MNIFVYIHTISNTCLGCIRPKYIVRRKGYVQIKLVELYGKSVFVN